MEVKDELKYSKDHEWVSVERNVVTIGITDYAQNSLGDIVFVELPEVGTIVDMNESIGSIESVKAVSDLNSPLDGEVVEINKKVEEDPGLVNSDPYENGWMIKMKIAPSDLDSSNLLDSDAYLKLTGSQATDCGF